MATNAIALPEGFELDEPAVAKPSGPPAGFVLDAPKAPEQPKGLPPGFVLDSPVSKGNKTADDNSLIGGLKTFLPAIMSEVTTGASVGTQIASPPVGDYSLSDVLSDVGLEQKP